MMGDAPDDAPVLIACQAMNCRFEMVLTGDDPVRLHAAGQEALEEIQALERRLSYFLPSSELSRINASAAAGWVSVEAGLFDLLSQCRQYWQDSDGLFDPTLSPLLELWGFHGHSSDGFPSEHEIAEALQRTGMQHVEFDSQGGRIRFNRPGLTLNLGAIGKGYALDCACEILRDCGVTSALLHAGTSSVRALGAPPGKPSWAIALVDPRDDEKTLAHVGLRDDSLGVSAHHLNVRLREGRRVGHVIHPLRGKPVKSSLLAAVVCTGAAQADALSTALLCLDDNQAALSGGPRWPLWRQRLDALLRLDHHGRRSQAGQRFH